VDPPVSEDPWLLEMYESDADGMGTFGNVVTIGTTDVHDRAFIVHATDGSRIGCGLLEYIPADQIYVAMVTPIGDGSISADVTLFYRQSDGMVYYTGSATGLPSDGEAALMLAESCASNSTVFEALDLPLSASNSSTAYFAHSFMHDDEGIAGHGFIIVDADGNRLSCGEVMSQEDAAAVNGDDAESTSTNGDAASSAGHRPAALMFKAAAGFAAASVFW